MVCRWRSVLTGVLVGCGAWAVCALGAEPLLLEWGVVDAGSAAAQAESAGVVRRCRARTAAGEASEGAWLVQFDGVIQPGWREWLEEMGAEIKGYMPENGYLVWCRPAVVAAVAEGAHVAWVGEWKAEYKVPGARAAARAAKAAGTERLEYLVEGFDGAGAAAMQAKLEALGCAVEWARDEGDRCAVAAWLGEAELETVSGWAEVAWIERRVAPQVCNDKAILTNMMNVTGVWKSVSAGGLGLTGAGQVVGIADTGLDTGNLSTLHPDFTNRVTGFGWTNTGYHAYTPWQDWGPLAGHGTHVAGSVAGSGYMSGGQYRGLAYEANIVFQGCQTNLSGLNNLSALLGQAWTNGARIHSDSWGYGTNYSGVYMSESQLVDKFMWEHPEFLVVLAAGNDGIDQNKDGVIDGGSVSAPGTAKNCLCVGAANNYRSSGGYSAKTWKEKWPSDYPANPVANAKISHTTTPQGLAAFSGRGPCNDGRLKPDLVAPGTDVISARSRAATGTGWGVAGNTNYLYMGGTSMATPLTAGALALERQWLQEQGFANPSAALMKSLLMNGARDMAPGQYGTGSTQEIFARPDMNQGHGHVDLHDTLVPGAGRFLELHDATNALTTGGEHTYKITVGETNAGTYSVTMGYTDYYALSGSGKKLVNDLDLVVTSPGGTIFYPNHLGMRDHTNNVETIDFTASEVGDYTVSVQGYNVTSGGAQKYALVMRGPDTAVPEPAAPVFSTAAVSAAVVLGEEYELEFQTLLAGVAYPTPEWTLTVSPETDDYDFENGYLDFLTTTGVGTYVFVCTASNSEGSASCTLTLTVGSGVPAAPTSPWTTVLGTTNFTVAWNAVEYADSYQLDVLKVVSEGGEAMTAIEETFSGWSQQDSYGSGTAAGSGGTWTYANAIVQPNGAASTPGSTGFVQLRKADGVLTLPAVDAPQSMALNARASSSDGALMLERQDGETWTAVTNWSLDATARGLSAELGESVDGVTYRLCAGANRTIYVHDLTVTAGSGATYVFVAGYSNLTVNGTSQVVSGLESGTSYAFRVRAVNGFGASEDSPLVTVTTVETDSAPSWAAIPAQSVAAGEELLFDFGEYVSGVPVPTLTLAGTTAEGGYEFDQGVLLYTPASEGATTFTALASNRVGTASATLAVIATASAPSFTTVTTAFTVVVGNTVDFTATATGAPAPTVTLTGSTASANDYLDEGGYVVFTPSATGTFTFTFTATNCAGSATQVITVTVSDVPVTVPTLSLTNATTNGFTASWTACDGVASYTLQVATDDEFSSAAAGESITESFAHITMSPGGSSYSAQTISNGDWGTWTATGCRGDLSVPCVSAGGTLTSPVVGGGAVSVEVSYSWPYSESGTSDLGLLVNGTLVGTQSVTGGTSGMATFEFTAVAGDVQLVFTNMAATRKRMNFNSVTLTGVGGGGASLLLEETTAETAYVVAGLASETTYYARVKGADDWSAVKSIATTARVLQPPVWSDIPVETLTVDEEYEWTLTEYVSGAEGDITMTSTAPSDEYDYEAETGYLYYIPQTAGEFTFTFTATNADGSASATLAVTVEAAGGGGPVDDTAYAAWLAGLGLTAAHYPQTNAGTNGLPNWQNYLADIAPTSTNLLELVAVGWTNNGVVFAVPAASANRTYGLVTWTNVLAAPTTNDLGHGVPGMVVTNTPVEHWFGRLRVTVP